MEKGKQLQRTFEYCPVKQGIRSVIIDGEPWFVAKDVCEALGIGNSRDSMSRLEDDEKAMSVLPTQFGDKAMNVVNESGLYNLIFQSRKPEARAFRKWVTSEVLPSIRRNGMYGTYSVVRRNVTVTSGPLPERGEMISVIDAALSRGRMQDVADAIGSTYGAVKVCKSRFKRGTRGVSALMLLVYGWCVEELNNNSYEKA